MATPIYIAVNQTASVIELVELRLTIPANGQVNLTNFNEIWRIQADKQLKDSVTFNQVLINDGSETLSKVHSLQYLSPVAATHALEDVEAGADVTSWTNVSSALGGQAGSNVNFVFKSNGSGSGSMVKSILSIPNRITVGLAGDVDYNTISSAITTAINGGASVSNPWEIFIYPGIYTESPLTMIDGILLSSDYVGHSGTVSVIATDPNEDLITCTGGKISGLKLSGVTDPTKCLIRASGTSTRIFLDYISIYNCYNGIIIDNAYAHISSLESIIYTTGQRVINGLFVTGSSAILYANDITMVVPSVILPSYLVNPIQIGVKVANGANANILNSVFDIADKDNTSSAIFADGGSFVSANLCNFNNCGNCFYIGSDGYNTKVILNGNLFFNNNYNLRSDSSTGILYTISGATDLSRRLLTEGTKILGSFNILEEQDYKLLGDVDYNFTSNKDVDLANFFISFGHSGILSGGDITEGIGLQINISDGYGFVRRELPYNDIESVEWISDIVDLTPSSTNYVYYNSTSQTLVSELSLPGETGILLATVITNDVGIRFLHKTRKLANKVGLLLQEYLLDTRTQVLKSGLSAISLSDFNFSVDSGSYYLGLDTITYDGYLNNDGYSTFSYFYGNDGYYEISNQTNIDGYYYSNNGILTELTDGYYRKDYLILTSDGRLSLIYGTTEQDTVESITSDPTLIVPTFLQYSNFPICEIIVQKDIGINSIIDKRPVKAWSSGAGGSGVSIHSLLSGLNSDDHTGYLRADGFRPMSGDLQMGEKSITGVDLIDGVDISAHYLRHNPGGLDALSTGIPVAVLVGEIPAIGSGSSYALNDHQHGMNVGTPVGIGTENFEGSSSSVSRSDHAHAHEQQTDETLHAVATVSSNGFMSSIDKEIHNQLASGNLSFLVKNETGSTLEKGRAIAAIGWDNISDLILVNYADKDIGNFRPSIGILSDSIDDGYFGHVTVQGLLTGLNTSEWELTDQLVLGNDGYLIRPPPDNIYFTGEIQNLASTVKIDDVDGYIVVCIDGLQPVTGEQIFALAGTAGTPSSTNKYVTHNDTRITADQAVATASIRTLGTGALQACAGNDSRLANDRTTSGIRSATTIVSLSAATAPTIGQMLTATSETAAIWQTPLTLTSDNPVNITKDTAVVGDSIYAARSNHKHDISTANATTLTVGGDNSEGETISLARSDHKHALPAFGTTSGTFCEGNDLRLTNDRTSSGLRSVTTVVSVSAATAPTIGQVLMATSESVATWQTPLVLTNEAPVNITKDTAAVGDSIAAARANHKHDISTAIAVNSGQANAEGVLTTLARSDHIHKGSLVQTIESRISVDTTSTTSFADLLTVSITTTGSDYLLIHFTASGDNTNNSRGVYFRITVDTVTRSVCGYTCSTNGLPSTASTQVKVPVTAGVHTVKVQWRSSANTGRIRPITNPDFDGASLIVSEILY